MFAEVMRKNPISNDLVHLYINKVSDFPGLGKYLISLMKISVELQGYACHWETVKFLDEGLLQHTI
jgi:hypothetical protein